jgi:hypothetical protein
MKTIPYASSCKPMIASRKGRQARKEGEGLLARLGLRLTFHRTKIG